jgi:murein L,D-transpeptidase YafK
VIVLPHLLKYCLLVIATSWATSSYAQEDIQSFRNNQLSNGRVKDAWKKYDDSLKRLFERKGINYPPHNIYLRNFKSQNEMELWASNTDTTEYKLIKTYRICALSGSLGPKRYQGDRQVPEGYYYIDDFNPHSEYHLSLQLNYPNYSDLIFADRQRPGGDIFIHGGCVTVGCLPMTDPGIQELYTLCLTAHLNGQMNIPVHIFPLRLTKNNMNYLNKTYASDITKQAFWKTLKGGYEYFEKNHKLLPVMYTKDGKYAF